MLEFLKKWLTPKEKKVEIKHDWIYYTQGTHTPQNHDDILQHVLSETWNSDDGTLTFEIEKEGQ
jgi:hypothetical protein